MKFADLRPADKRGYAQAYAKRLGMSAIPVIGKVPIAGVNWSDHNRALYVKRADWEDATGYALLPILGSNRAVIDFDSESFWLQALAMLPALRAAFTVGRGANRHVYVQTDRPLPQAILSVTQGKRELGSLRSYGAYVVGPESDHESGEQYTHVGGQHPARLDAAQTDALIALFTPPPPAAIEPDIIPVASAPGANDPGYVRLLDRVIGTLQTRGYRQHGKWLNGQCPFVENHVRGDLHPSFGIDTTTGVGHCFCSTCGDHNLFEIAAAVSIDVPRTAAGRFSFISNPAANQAEESDRERTITTEINITTELLRRRRAAAAVLFDCLTDASRREDGRHTYQYMDIVEIGQGFGLSRTQVTKNLAVLVGLGLLIKPERGIYKRVSIEESRAALGIDAGHAEARITLKDYTSLRLFKRAIVVKVGSSLPTRQPANKIAASTGMSRSTLYAHERGIVERQTITRRSAPAAAGTDFIKVFNSRKQFVVSVSAKDPFGAMERAINEGGAAFGWMQLPSIRRYPVSKPEMR